MQCQQRNAMFPIYLECLLYFNYKNLFSKGKGTIMKLDAQIAFRTTNQIKSLVDGLATKQGKKPSQVLNEIVSSYFNDEKPPMNQLERLAEKLEEHERVIAQLQKMQSEMAKK